MVIGNIIKGFSEHNRRKTELIFLVLIIAVPLVLIYIEPLAFLVSEKVADIFAYSRSFIVIGIFLLFCLLSGINSILHLFKRTNVVEQKEAASSKLIYILVIFSLFVVTTNLESLFGRNQELNTLLSGAILSLIYFSLILYAAMAYLGSIFSWYKYKPHQVLVLFSVILILSWLVFTVNIWGLYEKVRDLRWENAEIKSRLEEFEEVSNILREERTFEKEMRENLVYYLPDAFSSDVTYLGLTPIDFETGKARVYFIHRGKNYSVDLSYYQSGEKLKIERESMVLTHL